jgi:hypothetical protein
LQCRGELMTWGRGNGKEKGRKRKEVERVK